MKIKDIVRLAAVFLQLDVNEEVFCGDADRAFVEAELSADKRLKLLKDCAEFVLNQLATDYLPLEKNRKGFFGGRHDSLRRVFARYAGGC